MKLALHSGKAMAQTMGMPDFFATDANPAHSARFSSRNHNNEAAPFDRMQTQHARRFEFAGNPPVFPAGI